MPKNQSTPMHQYRVTVAEIGQSFTVYARSAQAAYDRKAVEYDRDHRTGLRFDEMTVGVVLVPTTPAEGYCSQSKAASIINQSLEGLINGVPKL